MPRDASATRARLLDEAQRLFATRGVYQATVREIIEAAGQRNASALNYHFGSRDGVLWAIIAHHGDPLDEERGELVVEPIDDMPTRALVASLLVPLARRLDTPDGRNYLRIVAQLTHRFPAWRSPVGNPPHLRQILGVLEGRAGSDPALQRERVLNLIMLMTTAMAERARAVEEGAPLELDTQRFVANLADVIVAGVEAPVGPALGAPSQTREPREPRQPPVMGSAGDPEGEPVSSVR